MLPMGTFLSVHSLPTSYIINQTENVRYRNSTTIKSKKVMSQWNVCDWNAKINCPMWKYFQENTYIQILTNTNQQDQTYKVGTFYNLYLVHKMPALEQ